MTENWRIKYNTKTKQKNTEQKMGRTKRRIQKIHRDSKYLVNS